MRNIAGRWSLELWREHMGRWDSEFVERFNDLEEAKRVGYAMARVELAGKV